MVDRHDIYIIDKESHILCIGCQWMLLYGRGKITCFVYDQSISDSRSVALANLRCDQSEWSLAEAYCFGVVEGQTLPELETPVWVNKTLVSNTNTVASSIHPIELT